METLIIFAYLYLLFIFMGKDAPPFFFVILHLALFAHMIKWAMS